MLFNHIFETLKVLSGDSLFSKTKIMNQKKKCFIYPMMKSYSILSQLQGRLVGKQSIEEVWSQLHDEEVYIF